MDMTISLGTDDRVDAAFDDGLTIATAQKRPAPSPFELFLASIGTCAGFYISSFCRRRGIPVDGIRIRQRLERDPETDLIGRILIDVELPDSFPASYREAAIRSAQACAVKKHLERPPVIDVRAL